MNGEYQKTDPKQIFIQAPDNLADAFFASATAAAQGQRLLNKELSVLTPTQQIALWWYEQDVNVFPQPYGKKSGFPHRLLQTNRLYYHSQDRHPGDLLSVAAGRCNLAIYTGRTSRNLFIIDCETQKTFDSLIQQLQQRQIPLWAVEFLA